LKNGGSKRSNFLRKIRRKRTPKKRTKLALKMMKLGAQKSPNLRAKEMYPNVPTSTASKALIQIARLKPMNLC
jgi:hypothetical protein